MTYTGRSLDDDVEETTTAKTTTARIEKEVITPCRAIRLHRDECSPVDEERQWRLRRTSCRSAAASRRAAQRAAAAVGRQMIRIGSRLAADPHVSGGPVPHRVGPASPTIDRRLTR